MTTAVQVQYRRGTQSQMAAFTGAAGELNVDTTYNRVVVQDGTTAGGWPAARLSEIGGGFLNKFRNGTMDVWQRGTSGLTATTAGAYTADGWIVLPTGASVTAAQAGGRLVTKASLQVTGAASVTDVIIKQRIESLIAAALCSQTVTVQAQIFNNTGGSITPKLTVNRPSAQDNYASVTADVNAVSLQACAASAWTLVSYTFQANASAFNGLEIAFDFGNNFSSSGKSIQITECDIRVTNGVPTGTNANPPVPELRFVASELALCQRYYYPLTVQQMIGQAVSSSEVNFSGELPNMRGTPNPVLVKTSFVNTSFDMLIGGNWISSSGMALAGVTTTSVAFGGGITGFSSLTAGQMAMGNTTGTAITFGSEL